jgi:hypothetical protein
MPFFLYSILKSPKGGIFWPIPKASTNGKDISFASGRNGAKKDRRREPLQNPLRLREPRRQSHPKCENSLRFPHPAIEGPLLEGRRRDRNAAKKPYEVLSTPGPSEERAGGGNMGIHSKAPRFFAALGFMRFVSSFTKGVPLFWAGGQIF